MGRNGKRIDAERGNVERNMSVRLHGIGVEQNTQLMRNCSELCNRLNGANLVIRGHNGNQDSIRANRSSQAFRAHPAVGINRQIRYLKTSALKPARRFEHRMMLYRRDDEVVSLFLVRKCNALQRRIVSFAAARGEAKLARPRIDR